MVPKEPTTATMFQEKIKTTTVRKALATTESVSLIPHNKIELFLGSFVFIFTSISCLLHLLLLPHLFPPLLSHLSILLDRREKRR